jgi:transcription elongation factor GreB
MGRYRPVSPKGSQYITPAGEQKLRLELEQLWRVERPAVTQAVQEAAAQGDRSENAEYIYGKRRLREIDRRVRFLRQRLDGMVVVTQAPSVRTRVFFAAWVQLLDTTGERFIHRIVGPDEFADDPRYISMDSPLGQALMGKSLAATITLSTPQGQRQLVIEHIGYGATPPTLTGG